MIYHSSIGMSMGDFSECILTVISLNPLRSIATRYISSEPLFYRWQFDENKAQELPQDTNSVFERLGEGTLLVKLGGQSLKQESYPTSSVREIKSRFLRKRKGYEFKYSLTSSLPSLLYHVVLPEFCYCDEESINKQENLCVKTTGIDKRQSVTWVNSISEGKDRKFKLKFLFYGPDERRFREIQKEIPTVIVIPEKAKTIYKEFKTLAPIAISGLSAAKQ
jgi:hypothetical protein